MRGESDLSLEVVVLLIFGVFWLLFGQLLVKIYTGDLPYGLDSTYGLLLVIVSFQMITWVRLLLRLSTFMGAPHHWNGNRYAWN
jgi:hypothetical protein